MSGSVRDEVINHRTVVVVVVAAAAAADDDDDTEHEFFRVGIAFGIRTARRMRTSWRHTRPRRPRHRPIACRGPTSVGCSSSGGPRSTIADRSDPSLSVRVRLMFRLIFYQRRGCRSAAVAAARCPKPAPMVVITASPLSSSPPPPPPLREMPPARMSFEHQLTPGSLQVRPVPGTDRTRYGLRLPGTAQYPYRVRHRSVVVPRRGCLSDRFTRSSRY
jgi:hypothetical protein